ncbi:MAG: tRNA (N6-threonylcarbamoyladenosine(37)-N6)-methyltransferase TrmO [Lachnospiraceae bacterium]|nr:tRNA (N6-threonylcarbamoyladenosine(37)-N6)-methyltransferase TrmO [Lachnospiraceae bacterium]
MKEIGHIITNFPEKFGIPRQSGLVDTKGKIIFEPQYRTKDAFKGLEKFSHIWIIWKFSESKKQNWAATVKPPRLGGNKRLGVFATRSPFRPNPIGLSSVRLERIEYDERNGTILYISGVDMVDGTPIYDIKPYLPYTDCHDDAKGGFAEEVLEYGLEVEFSEELSSVLPPEYRNSVSEILRQDPRPSYIEDSKRIYGVLYAGYNIRFYVQDDIAKVIEVQKIK